MTSKRQPSFLKWAGGKRKLMSQFHIEISSLEEIGQRWKMEDGERYHEPFMGSGSAFFGFKKSGTIREDSHAFLSDWNQILVATMIEVQSERLPKLMRTLKRFEKEYVEEIYSKGYPEGLSKTEREKRYFYVKRRRMNELIQELNSYSELPKSKWHELASTMIFLNKTCFNGLWRVSANGNLNVPEGRYKNPLNIYQPDILKNCQELLQNTVIQHLDFKSAFEKVEKGDLVYVDPPYIPLNLDDYVFTSYNSEGFGLEDQKQLAECAAHAVKVGGRVIASNNDHPVIRKIYLEAADNAGIPRPIFRTIPIKRTMNSKGDGRIQVNEILMFMHPNDHLHISDSERFVLSSSARYSLSEIQENQEICSQFLNELPRNKKFLEIIEVAHTLCPDLKQFCEENIERFKQLKARDKGSMGKMAEFYIFGQLPNSDPTPDLNWGADIKATHFKITRDGYNAKERLTITNCGDTSDYSTFEKLMDTDSLHENHYYSKLRKGILLVFEHQGGTYNTVEENLQKKLLSMFTYDLDDMPDDVTAQFNEDFADIQEKVKTRTVSQKGQKFIHIAPHGSKGSSTRALCFKNKFVTKLLTIRTGIPLTIKGASWFIEKKHFSEE